MPIRSRTWKIPVMRQADPRPNPPATFSLLAPQLAPPTCSLEGHKATVWSRPILASTPQCQAACGRQFGACSFVLLGGRLWEDRRCRSTLLYSIVSGQRSKTKGTINLRRRACRNEVWIHQSDWILMSYAPGACTTFTCQRPSVSVVRCSNTDNGPTM